MEPDRPDYVEAYPRLNVFEGKLSSWNGGKVPLPVARFHVRGTMHAGWIVVLLRTEHHLRFNYDFPSSPDCQGADETTIELVERPNGVDRGRQYLKCDGCGKGVATLIFDQIWACRLCLNLRYRSQCVGTPVRLAEEYDALQQRLGKQRPKHMQQARYERERERLEELREKIGRNWSTASDAYATVVEAEWLTVDQFGQFPHPKYEIRDGHIAPIEWKMPQVEAEKKPAGMKFYF